MGGHQSKSKHNRELPEEKKREQPTTTHGKGMVVVQQRQGQPADRQIEDVGQ